MSLLNIFFNTASHFFLDNSSFLSTVYRSTNLACRTLSNNSFWTFQSQIPNSSSNDRRSKGTNTTHFSTTHQWIEKRIWKNSLTVFKNLIMNLKAVVDCCTCTSQWFLNNNEIEYQLRLFLIGIMTRNLYCEIKFTTHNTLFSAHYLNGPLWPWNKNRFKASSILLNVIHLCVHCSISSWNLE